MSISQFPSTVTLPPAEKPYPSLIDFFIKRFPNISEDIWLKRISEGKILDEKGNKISFATQYLPGKRLHYFREIENEPQIPFKEKILFENHDFIIVDKPHFLPVTPSGPYVNECLLNRLKISTGNESLTPVNRIDMNTAGLVMFSCKKDTRNLYYNLFMKNRVHKTYEAITEFHHLPPSSSWTIKNRIVKGDPWFRMKIEKGKANAITKISLIKTKKDLALFRLFPVTGKKHQLRLHLSSMGFAVINDPFYPKLLEKKDPDYEKPLQLLAKKIEFTDPLTRSPMRFSSRQTLSRFC